MVGTPQHERPLTEPVLSPLDQLFKVYDFVAILKLK